MSSKSEKLQRQLDENLARNKSDGPRHEASPRLLLQTFLNAPATRISQETASSDVASYESQLPVSQLSKSQLSVSYQDTKLDINWRRTPHTRIPQIALDEIMPTLPPHAQVAYLQLLRLTLGHQRPLCRLSLSQWASRSNQSVASIKRQADQLIKRGLLKKAAVQFGGNERGLTLLPVIPGVLNDDKPSQLSVSQLRGSQLSVSHKKEKEGDDDDLETKDHHRKNVMIIYTSITKNPWRKSDNAAYEKIKDIEPEVIRQAITVATARAKDPPNSLAYFVAEILKLADPTPKTRAQHKRALKKLIDQYRNLHTGARKYRLSDLAADVKAACLREGVPFDNDLFNEIIGL